MGRTESRIETIHIANARNMVWNRARATGMYFLQIIIALFNASFPDQPMT